MNSRIEKQLQQIDTKLAQLLDDLKKYPHEVLNKKPTPNSWSALQVMQHLMLVENLSAKYVQKKLSFNPKLKNAGIGTMLRQWWLRSYNFLPVKLKAPKNVNSDNFPAESKIEDIAQQWQEQRQQLRAYLTTLPEEIFNKEVYKHPIAGRQSLYAMLEFYNGHFNRHLKQIKRTLGTK